MPVRFQPREYLLDPSEFGRLADARWGAGGQDELGQVAASFFQHQVACGVRVRMGERNESLRALAGRLDLGTETLGRRLTGVVPARLEDLLALVFAFEDITLLPTATALRDLLPPVQ